MVRHIAYQGAPGAFAEAACREFMPEWHPLARPTFAAVIAAVLAGEAERGMLPLRNSAVGDVPGVEALIRDSGLLLLARHRLPVRMNLLAVPGAALDGIRLIASHMMALAQCRNWLDEAGIETVEEANTALAAQALAASGDPHKAVIASDVAARAYGLLILAADIQDSDDNATTFGVVARGDGGAP